MPALNYDHLKQNIAAVFLAQRIRAYSVHSLCISKLSTHTHFLYGIHGESCWQIFSFIFEPEEISKSVSRLDIMWG